MCLLYCPEIKIKKKKELNLLFLLLNTLLKDNAHCFPQTGLGISDIYITYTAVRHAGHRENSKRPYAVK